MKLLNVSQQYVVTEMMVPPVNSRPDFLKVTIKTKLMEALQGDHSGCVKPPVDINTKVVFSTWAS